MHISHRVDNLGNVWIGNWFCVKCEYTRSDSNDSSRWEVISVASANDKPFWIVRLRNHAIQITTLFLFLNQMDVCVYVSRCNCHLPRQNSRSPIGIIAKTIVFIIITEHAKSEHDGLAHCVL